MTRTKLQNHYSNIQYIGTKDKAKVPNEEKVTVGGVTPVRSDGCESKVGEADEPLVHSLKPESKLESKAESIRPESAASIQLESRNENIELQVTCPSPQPEACMAPLGSQLPTIVSATT